MGLLLAWQMLDLAYPWNRRMSAIEVRDPFEVDDVEVEAARARSLLADAPPTSTLETWFGRALLLVTLAAVLICDLQIVHDAPNYYPDNEANRVAVVQYIADHGTPPVLGTDTFMVDPTVPVPPNTTVIHRIIAGQSPTITVNTPLPAGPRQGSAVPVLPRGSGRLDRAVEPSHPRLATALACCSRAQRSCSCGLPFARHGPPIPPRPGSPRSSSGR